MADVLTKAQRSFNMSRIRARDTQPELVVRRSLHALGYRYRLHVASISGKPDIVLPKYQALIFVHGCFWHMHRCRFGRVIPRNNAVFWSNKRKSNVSRDRQVSRVLRRNWNVLVIWECETRDIEKLGRRLKLFLSSLS